MLISLKTYTKSKGLEFYSLFHMVLMSKYELQSFHTVWVI